MKRSGLAKFPQSEQLFKLCFKVLSDKSADRKVKDQEIGELLDYNPSDCSHWKRGEKNIKSVFELATLSEKLGVDQSLLHDVASSLISADEAYFEICERANMEQFSKRARELGVGACEQLVKRMQTFVATIHKAANFSTAPLYLPEVFRNFSYISTQPVDMFDRLSRILKVRDGEYCIQYKKGPLKAQTRQSIAKDFARILLHAERARFPELKTVNETELAVEAVIFVSYLLAPPALLKNEMDRVDLRKNLVQELATTFWVPRRLVSHQLARLVTTSLQSKQAPTLERGGDTLPIADITGIRAQS